MSLIHKANFEFSNYKRSERIQINTNNNFIRMSSFGHQKQNVQFVFINEFLGESASDPTYGETMENKFIVARMVISSILQLGGVVKLENTQSLNSIVSKIASIVWKDFPESNKFYFSYISKVNTRSKKPPKAGLGIQRYCSKLKKANQIKFRVNKKGTEKSPQKNAFLTTPLVSEKREFCITTEDLMLCENNCTK